MSYVEGMFAERDPNLGVPLWVLLREPLLWVAAAAFVGASVGLVGTFWQAELISSYDYGLTAELYAGATQTSGATLALLSLLAVPSLTGDRSTVSQAVRLTMRLATVVGVILLVALAVVGAASVYYLWYWNTPEVRYESGPLPTLERVSLLSSILLPSAVVLPFVLVALIRRRWRLGALLVGLCVLSFPFALVLHVFPSSGPSQEDMYGYVILGFLGRGVSLPGAILWGLLCFLIFSAARERSRGEAERLAAEENRKKALRLYEEGLGMNDPSVVEEVISEDFRDLGRGVSGKGGVERFLGELWTSYPDLSVEVEGQETEGDLVRTRVLLSGTDRGEGVMWYPPTGRSVSFKAEFSDRFSGGKLIEHSGEADTEGLLRQLGLSQADDGDA